MICLLLVSAIVGLLAYKLYKWSTHNHDYFERRGVKHIKSGFFGNFGFFLNTKSTAADIGAETYEAFPNEPIYGRFDFSGPVYVVRDPALIKQLGVKDFDHFENHVGLDSDGIDVLFESGLFMLRGEKWRHMRGTLSPAFTGTKMRQMFQLVVDCADTTVAHFTQNAAKGQSLPVEIKDLFTRYSNDVIASCAFGIKVNSIEHPNNEFFESGSRLVNIFSFGNILKMFILSKYPIINRLFNVGILDKTVSKFFRSMVDETMETRRQHNIFRPDMVNILMQVRDGTLRRSNETGEELDDSFAAAKESHVGQAVVTRKWTDDELIAQCFLFFFAGFETASTVLSFAAYEMVVNPDVQQRLYEEIAANEAELNGERLTYENIQKMKYLDQVVSEILRKWSPLANIDRTCSKDYDFNHNGMKFTIEKGRVLLFPMYGLHHDAQYFPEPQRFDPDRFSDENRDKIVPGTYIPFGFGPRNCIGSRFGLMEVKALLYKLLLNYSLDVNEKTQIPMQLKSAPITLSPKDGVYLTISPRQ